MPKFIFFCGLTFDFFKIKSISFVYMKTKSNIKWENCKGNEKRDCLLDLKMDFNFQTFQRTKKLAIDPIFSNWVKFNKKVSIKLLWKFKEL